MAAVPLLPPLVAVIVALPTVTPVTSPEALTAAAAPLLVVQVIVRPLSGFPAESLAVALSCSVLPTATLANAGLTVTEATGTTVTVSDAVPLCPPLVAVMVVEPAARAVTSPLVPTVATVVLPLDHATLLPVSGFPPESFGVAVSCTVCPTKSPDGAGAENAHARQGVLASRVAGGGHRVVAARGRVIMTVMAAIISFHDDGAT